MPSQVDGWAVVAAAKPNVLRVSSERFNYIILVIDRRRYATYTFLTEPIMNYRLPILLAAISVAAFAQAADTPFQVRYASNLAVGDSVINITNTGANSSRAFPTQDGGICVNAYAFSPDEQLISCCSCFVTPDGLASLSVRNDLISNTLTPGVPTGIVVKLLSSAGTGNGCSAATVGTAPNTIVSGLAAWGTTIHPLPVTPGTPATTFGVTETPFTPSTLSAAELTRITTLCGFIQTNGSGFGICKACRLGGLGASNSSL